MVAISTIDICISEEREAVQRVLQGVLGECAARGEGAVGEAVRYAVLGGGQRVRPILAMRVARLVGGEGVEVERAAAAVELLHCASLIIDDLPCMDDSDFRRGQPSVHVAFGQATAVLGAFSLVALAARSVLESVRDARWLPSVLEFQRQLLRTLDCGGLIAGQAMDLEMGPHVDAVESVTIAQLKTVPLFELAVRAGLLHAGPGSPLACRLLRFGREFGIAFQMADDYDDGHAGSLPAVLAQLDRTRAVLHPLGERARELTELVDYLDARTSQEDRRYR
jgi:farnesyl diphosphate synthase